MTTRYFNKLSASGKPIFGGSISDHKTAMSVQDKKALQILEASAELVDGHYQVGLPWKHNPPSKQSIARAEEAKLFETKIPERSGII